MSSTPTSRRSRSGASTSRRRAPRSRSGSGPRRRRWSSSRPPGGLRLRLRRRRQGRVPRLRHDGARPRPAGARRGHLRRQHAAAGRAVSARHAVGQRRARSPRSTRRSPATPGSSRCCCRPRRDDPDPPRLMSVAAPPPRIGDAPPRPLEPRPARTVATLGLLSCALPVNLAVTAVALAREPRDARAAPGADRAGARTILISGGKMTKALHLARAFHRAGHRVVLVEAREVPADRTPVLARRRPLLHGARRRRPGYAAALLEIVGARAVDVYVPVCSPASARDDACAKAELEEYCEVLHFDPETLDRLDDKYAFSRTARRARSAGARRAPDHRRRAGARLRLRAGTTRPTSSRASPMTRSAGST